MGILNNHKGSRICTLRKDRNLLKCKRSQGQIEMILSFVIFVGFVFALFIFFTPVHQDTVSYASLENTQASILSNATINYDYASIILNSSCCQGGKNCFIIENPLDSIKKMIVKDSEGRILASRLSSPNSFFIKSYNDRYYKLYFSDLFSPEILGDTDCQTLSKGIDYNTAVVSSGSDVLYENILKIDDEYMQNYSKLKDDLGLLNEFEFAVYNFSYSVLKNDTLSVHKVKTFPVLSRDIPIHTLTENGAYKDLIMTLRVWK